MRKKEKKNPVMKKPGSDPFPEALRRRPEVAAEGGLGALFEGLRAREGGGVDVGGLDPFQRAAICGGGGGFGVKASEDAAAADFWVGVDAEGRPDGALGGLVGVVDPQSLRHPDGGGLRHLPRGGAGGGGRRRRSRRGGSGPRRGGPRRAGRPSGHATPEEGRKEREGDRGWGGGGPVPPHRPWVAVDGRRRWRRRQTSGAAVEDARRLLLAVEELALQSS